MNPHHGYGIHSSGNDTNHYNNTNNVSTYQCNNNNNGTCNYRDTLIDYDSNNGRCDNNTNRYYCNTDNNHGYSKARGGRYSNYDGRNFNSYYNSVILSSSCEDVSRTGTGASMAPRCKYSIRLKLEVIEYSRKFSIHKTARQFRIDRKTVRDWRAQEAQLRRRLKIEKIDNEVLVFYQLQQEKKLQVSQEDLKTKAMEIFRQMVQEGIASGDEFEATEDWVRKFVKRYKLNIDQVSVPCTKAPAEYVDEFLHYLLDKQKLPVPCQVTTKDDKVLRDKDQYKIENLK